MRIAGGEEYLPSADLDAEDEWPFLRRQKAVAVRRRRFRARLRWVVWAVGLIIATGGAATYLARFAVHSPLFVLSSAEDVAVYGNQYVTPEEVLTAVGFPERGSAPAGVNVFRMSLSEKREQVETIPWVRAATLTRAYPHGLGVHVVERQPVAFVNVGGRLKLVDTEGAILNKPERAALDFPVLAGLDASGGMTERRQRLAIYQEFQAQVAEEASRSGWLISEVNLSDPDNLTALVVQGPETMQLRFGNRDFLERFRNFLALLPELRKNSGKIESIDLRYNNQIVVNPRAADGAAAEASNRAPPRKGRMKITWH